MARDIASMVRFGFPEDYWESYPERMRAQTTADLARTAIEVVHPDKLTWVVVGDRAKIEDAIRSAGFGPIRLVDADGQPISTDSNPGEKP